MRPTPAKVLGFGLFALGSCTGGGRYGGGFDLQYPSSTGPELEAVSATLTPAGGDAPTAVAVLVPPAPAQGFTVVDLASGRRLGQCAVPVDARPTLLGDLVVSHLRGAVVAFGLDGAERWRVSDDGLGLNAAARDGDHVALTLGGSGVTRRDGLLVVVDAASGSVRVRRRVRHALGAPAVLGGQVFVPWDGQNLSVFDIDDDREVARVRSRDDVFGLAVREGPAVFFGARALYRFGPGVAGGRRSEMAHYLFDHGELPGNPPFTLDPYASMPAGLNARERVRAAWRPDPTAVGVGLLDNTLYAVFWRDIFALDATTGAVRWGYVNPADLAGVAVARGGIAFVDEQGHAGFVDNTRGRPVWTADLGAPAAQAVLQLPATFPPSHNVPEDPAATLAAGLLEAAGGTDTRLLPAQLFAVRALGALEGPDATRALVSIVGRRSYGQDLRAAAGEALTRRTSGAEAMIEALETHYDYVRQTEAPPVGLLARGLGSSHETRGVAGLVAHLGDPATPVRDLPPLVAALKDLRDPAALPALVDFLRTYHADQGGVPAVSRLPFEPPPEETPGADPAPLVDDRVQVDQDAMATALEQAAEAVVALGTAEHLQALDDILADSFTPQALRIAIARLRGARRTPTPTATGDGGTPSGPGAPPPTTVPPGLPLRLSPDQISAAFSQFRPGLLSCLDGAPSRPSQVRIQFRYDNEGHVSHVVVAPTSFQACMQVLVEQVPLPPSLVAREIGTYLLDAR